MTAPMERDTRLPHPDFHDGQILEARQLNALHGMLVGLQRWHNRAMHDWGVASGLTVRAGADGRTVIVSPGRAVDDQGREIFLCDPVPLDVPVRPTPPGARAKELCVTVSYKEEPAQPPPSEGCCSTRGPASVRRPAREVRWRDPEATADGERLEPGRDLILVTVATDRGRVLRILDKGRRSATPETRPFIAAGRASLVTFKKDDSVARRFWRWWPGGNLRQLEEEFNRNASGFAKVDTAPAGTWGVLVRIPLSGFGNAPVLHAQVERPDSAAPFSEAPQIIDVDTERALVVLPIWPRNGGTIEAGAEKFEKGDWRIAWFGVEG